MKAHEHAARIAKAIDDVQDDGDVAVAELERILRDTADSCDGYFRDLLELFGDQR